MTRRFFKIRSRKKKKKVPSEVINLGISPMESFQSLGSIINIVVSNYDYLCFKNSFLSKEQCLDVGNKIAEIAYRTEEIKSILNQPVWSADNRDIENAQRDMDDIMLQLKTLYNALNTQVSLHING